MGSLSSTQTRKALLLANQTWVCSRACSKTNLLTLGRDEGKCSVYCRAPSKESRQLVLKRLELPDVFQGKVFKDRAMERVAECVISLWAFFWLVGGELIRSQHLQPSGSNRSAVYVLVGSMQPTSPTWRGFQYLQNSSKDTVQNIIYSPWGGTKGLCLMAKLLFFCRAWLFPFVSAFSHFSD